MLTNLKKSCLFFLLSTLLLQGCSPNEGELWGLGAFVFSIFVCIVALNALVPTLQEYEVIKKWLAHIENIIQKGFKLLVLLSLLLIALGIFNIISNPKPSSKDLIIFIGALLLYLSINMNKWAVEKDKHKKRNYVRVMGLCVTFMFSLIWLMSGAPGLNL